MSHLGTHLAPLAVSRTVGKLDEVECIVDVGLQPFGRTFGVCLFLVPVLVLAGNAHVEHGQGSGTQLFAQEEVFIEAQSIALEIVGIVAVGEGRLPAVLVQRTVLYRSHGVLPLVACGEVAAFDDAPSGETEDTGMQVEECLCEVLAHAVLMPHPGICREERDMLQVDGTCARTVFGVGEEDTQVGLFDGSWRTHHEGVLLPLAGVDGEVLADECLPVLHRVLVDELHQERHRLAVGDTCPHREAVVVACLQPDAEEAFVLDAGPHVVVSCPGKADIVRIPFKGAVVAQGDIAEHLPAHVVVGGKFERAVLDQFGIQTTVCSEVDVFKEDTVHGRLDGCTHLAGLHRHGVVLCMEDRSCGCECQSG